MTTRILCNLFLTLLLTLSGCTTYNTDQYAKGYPENVVWFTYATRWTPQKPLGDHKLHLQYYALTPVTVLVDVLTCPVQFCDYWYVLLSNIGAQ